MTDLTDAEIHGLLDQVKSGDRLTITRANADGSLTATVAGPALADSGLDRAVGIDLLDGEPHLVRNTDGELQGPRIIRVGINATAWTAEALIRALLYPAPATPRLGEVDPSSRAAGVVVRAAIRHALTTGAP